MADSGEGSPPPHLFLDQTEARRAEKLFFGDWANPKPLPRLISRSQNPVLNSIILVLALGLLNLVNKNKYCWWNNSQIKEDVQFHLSQN